MVRAMPFAVAIAHEQAHLLVSASGPASLPDILGLIDMAATIAGMAGYRRVLINLMQVEIGFAFTEHLQIGARAAEKLRGMERVASIVDPRFRIGTSEKAAQKMGLQLRTFTSLDEGMQWLADGR
jgi:hypothetical protein